jgi:hypothetical protein
MVPSDYAKNTLHAPVDTYRPPNGRINAVQAHAYATLGEFLTSRSAALVEHRGHDENSEHAQDHRRANRRSVRLARRRDELGLRARNDLFPGQSRRRTRASRRWLSSRVRHLGLEGNRSHYSVRATAHMGYRALSTIPPSQHDGGSITLQEVPGGTELFWTSTGRLKAPVLSDSLTRLFAPLIKMGMVNVTRAAERALTGRPDVR